MFKQKTAYELRRSLVGSEMYRKDSTQASRQGMNFQARQQHLKESPWFWFGFGGTALLLMLIPIINIVVLPAAVVALAKRG